MVTEKIDMLRRIVFAFVVVFSVKRVGTISSKLSFFLVVVRKKGLLTRRKVPLTIPCCLLMLVQKSNENGFKDVIASEHIEIDGM